MSMNSAVDAAAHFNGSKTGNVWLAPYQSVACAPLSGVWRRSKTASVRWRQPQVWARFWPCVWRILKLAIILLAANQLFGSSIGLFNNYMAKFGVEVSYVDCFDNDAWAQAVQPNTKVIYCESPSNPLAQICDIGYLSQLCKANDILLVVDNCFATPALQRPLDLGADVGHSFCNQIFRRSRSGIRRRFSR